MLNRVIGSWMVFCEHLLWAQIYYWINKQYSECCHVSGAAWISAPSLPPGPAQVPHLGPWCCQPGVLDSLRSVKGKGWRKMEPDTQFSFCMPFLCQVKRKFRFQWRFSASACHHPPVLGWVDGLLRLQNLGGLRDFPSRMSTTRWRLWTWRVLKATRSDAWFAP